MKDYIREIVDKNLSQNDNENRLREYIQKYILFVIYRKKIYKDVIFTGGTALRFLYKLRRYSENLDFSISEISKNYDFLNILKVIKKELIFSGYKVDIKYSIDKTVHSAFFRFPDLPC